MTESLQEICGLADDFKFTVKMYGTDHYKYVTWYALSDRSASWPKPTLATDQSVSVSSPAERGPSYLGRVNSDQLFHAGFPIGFPRSRAVIVGEQGGREAHGHPFSFLATAVAPIQFARFRLLDLLS